MGTIFSVMGTLFDNSKSLDGTSPRPLIFAILFWSALFVLTVNSLYNVFEATVMTIFTSSGNWGLAWMKWIWTIIFFVLFAGASVMLSFGFSWAIFITLQHAIVNVTIPILALAEAIAIGWVFGWQHRVKHYGVKPYVIQAVLYFTGCIIMALFLAVFWQTNQVIVVGTFMVGLLLILSSLLLPAYFVKSHDNFGRNNTQTDAFYTTIFGSVEHLRQEINYRCCHSSQVCQHVLI